MTEQETRLLASIEQNKDAMIQSIADIVSVDSERGEPTDTAPYGPGPRKALDQTLQLAASMGFETEMVAGQLGIVKYGEGEDYIGIVGHLDVVPQGTGWTSPAYEPEIRDDRMYGRGVLDNKGPMYTCLYALKALKDQGITTRHPIWLIFGTNEETGMEDIPVYLQHKKPPVAGWTPDCKFPVVYAERGRAMIGIHFDTEEAMFDWVNAHLINNMPCERALKLDVTDPEFGKLEIRNKHLEPKEVRFAVSYPPCIDIDGIADHVKVTVEHGQVEVISDWKPVFFEKDGTLCRTLQSAYEEITGLDGTPVTTTGGTYAKRMPHIVPFGPSFPGQKGIGHLPDEWMNLDDLVSNAKIYGLSMLRLANEQL